MNELLSNGSIENGEKTSEEDQLAKKLSSLSSSTTSRVIRKFIMAALGSIPWVGGFLAAAQAFREESDQLTKDTLQAQWLEEHRGKMRLLAKDINDIVNRLNSNDQEVQNRIENNAYLDLVRKAFRSWDQSDTQDKKEYIKKLIANAGATTLCPDDLIRLFIDWLDLYHEAHFIVIRQIYKHPGITRYEMWQNIHGILPREDSSEADLFRLLIGDLSTGRVIRQHRETNYQGDFIKKSRPKSNSSSKTMKSAFDDEEPYELTELGKQFVHYVFSDIVTKIEDR